MLQAFGLLCSVVAIILGGIVIIRSNNFEKEVKVYKEEQKTNNETLKTCIIDMQGRMIHIENFQRVAEKHFGEILGADVWQQMLKEVNH